MVSGDCTIAMGHLVVAMFIIVMMVSIEREGYIVVGLMVCQVMDREELVDL